MPRIPIYEQRTSVSGSGLGPGPANAGSGLVAIGQALQSVAQDMDTLRAFEQQKRDEQDAVTANLELTDTKSAWAQRFEQLKQSAPADAANFTPSVLAEFDKDVAERLKRAPSAKSKAYLQQRFAEMKLGLLDDAQRFQAERVFDYKVNGLTQSIDYARTAAEFRPQDFATILAEQREAVRNSGLPEFQQAEIFQKSQEAIASASVQGMIRRNPYAALKELNDEKSGALAVQALSFDDRQRMRSAAETEIRSREADAREAQGRARQALADRVDDAQAAYLSGINVPDPPTRADFMAAFPADQREAERRYSAFTVVQQLGSDLQAASRMTPDEQIALLEKRRPTQVDGAADSTRAYANLVQSIGGLQKALADDPAQYVAKYNPAVSNAQDAFSQAPSAETAQAYAQVSVSAQRALGVVTPRLLTDAQAGAMSERLKLSGNGSDAVAAIDQERELWGRYWPQALAEAAPKLNPAVQVIALGMAPVPAARLASVAALKDEDFRKILPSNVKPSDVSAAVQQQLEDFSESLVGLAGAEDQLARISDAATRLAASYIAGGEKPSKAAERAAQEVVLARYDVQQFRGSALRIPKLDSDLVITGLASAHTRVMRELNVRGGDVRWRTLPDDSGVVLEDAATNRPLSKKDGSIVALTFDELSQAAVNRAEDARRLDAELRKSGAQR